MTGFESRWRDAMLHAVLPAGTRHPGVAGADLSAFWPVFEQAAPPVLQWGLRGAVWGVQTVSLARHGRSFQRLDADTQDALLVALADSRLFALRQIAFTLKHVACFAALRDPAFRARMEGQ